MLYLPFLLHLQIQMLTANRTATVQTASAPGISAATNPLLGRSLPPGMMAAPAAPGLGYSALLPNGIPIVPIPTGEKKAAIRTLRLDAQGQ